MVGGSRGLWALRVPLEHLGSRVYPDMFSLAQAHLALDERGQIASEALRDRFERFGVLSIVDERGEADAVLKGAILNVKQDTSTTTSRTDTALEVNTTITLAGEMRKTDGELLWRNKGFTVTRPFGSPKSRMILVGASGVGARRADRLRRAEWTRGQ